MTPQQYIDKNNRRQKIFERKYVPQIAAIIKSQMTELAGIVRSSGPDGLKIKLSSVAFNENVGQVIEDLYMEVAIYYARRTERQIRWSMKSQELKAMGFGQNEEWTRELIEYLRKNILSKAVVPISNTTKARALQIIERGINEGWSIDKMAFQLENDGLTLARARLIVRTELKMAENKGQQLAQESSEWETVKTWLSASDHRTRLSHVDANGQEVDEKHYFKVKRYKGKKFVGYDYMTGPGDPTAHPENLCNCRCTSFVRVKRDSAGRMIRKRKIFVALPGEFQRDRQILTI